MAADFRKEDRDFFLADALRNLNASERGNTWLLDYETGTHTNAWLHLHGNWYLEITIRPENYPGLTVTTIQITEEELTRHIQKSCCGMLVRKCNLEGVKLRTRGSVQFVADLEEAEAEDDDA